MVSIARSLSYFLGNPGRKYFFHFEIQKDGMRADAIRPYAGTGTCAGGHRPPLRDKINPSTNKIQKPVGATKHVTPTGSCPYGRRGEAKLRTTFFAKLSFKKARQPALPEPEAEEAPEASLWPEEEALLPEAELSAFSASLAAWMAAISW